MNNIDKIFSDKLKDNEKNPPPMAWDKIEARLQEKDRKKGIWWYYIAAGIALLIGVFVFTTRNDDKNNALATSEVIKPVAKKPLSVQPTLTPIISEDVVIADLKKSVNTKKTSALTNDKKVQNVAKSINKGIFDSDLSEISEKEVADINDEEVEFLPEEALAVKDAEPIVETQTASIQVVIKKGAPSNAYSIDTASDKPKNKIGRVYEQVVNLKNLKRVDLEEITSLLATNKKEKSNSK